MQKTDWRTDRIRVKTLLDSGQAQGEVFVQGWLRTVRRSKGVVFLALNDGSCLDSLQVVVGDDSAAFSIAGQLGTGACIGVRGEMVASPGEGQSWEIQAGQIIVYGEADETFPLQKKRHGFEFLRSIAHLRPRTNALRGGLSACAVASPTPFTVSFRNVVLSTSTRRSSPPTTAKEPESCSGLRLWTLRTRPDVGWSRLTGARISSDPRLTYLTVSGQLRAELFACALTDIYTFGPTFRAENSNTSRHASEFWMIEPEVAFADLALNCQLAEDFFRHMVTYALEHCQQDLAFFNNFIDKGLLDRLEKAATTAFQSMSYTEAVERLQQSGQSFEFPVEWGCDLQSEHERYLTEKIVGGPLFVTDYPERIKAFYMRRNDDGRTVAAMDLLVPKVGEIIGGSQREERLDVLQHKMRAFDILPESLDWYLDTRRWGSCPHAGFGLGFERFLMYLTGMENVRDVIPFPRTPGNARF